MKSYPAPDDLTYRHCCPSRFDMQHIPPCPFAQPLDACDQDRPPLNWRTCRDCETGCRWVPCVCGLPIRLVRLLGTLEVGWTHAAGVETGCHPHPVEVTPS